MFFLCLILAWANPVLLQGQASVNTLDSDSIQYYLQVVEQGEKQVGNALAKIGFIYMEAGKYNSALRYFDQSLPLLNGENKSKSVAAVYQAKGSIFQIFGDNAQPRRYYRLAENQFSKSLEIYHQIEDHGGELGVYRNLVDISTKRRNFASAVAYQNKVIDGMAKAYQDSLQMQAESFNELLNREIESSKDTILVERPDAGGSVTTGNALWSTKNVLLVLLGLLSIILFRSWWLARERLQDAEVMVHSDKTSRNQLQKKIDELQEVNLALSKTEKQQRHANLTKDKIFSIISHDIRSPINTISGFLNMLGVKLKSIGDIELKALAHEMEESTGRLSQFLDDLLKWSMSQMGKLEAQPEPIEIMDLVEENYRLVESRLESKNIHFKTDIDPEIRVYADYNMINLVLRNLIGNAIKFTRQGGYIAISLKRKMPEVAELIIADDGIGISADDLHKLFEFEGTIINGLPENKGAGLGLILCKEFVELNGGEISVQSTIGKGTRFIITLPIRSAQ